MESQGSVERKYAQLIKDVKTKEFYTSINLENRVNCYQCAGTPGISSASGFSIPGRPGCGHITKTRDIDPGVTPMFHACEKCGGRTTSSMYQDIAPTQQPTQEWYRPSLKQVLKMRKNPGMLQHVLAGGLDCRKIE